MHTSSAGAEGVWLSMMVKKSMFLYGPESHVQSLWSIFLSQRRREYDCSVTTYSRENQDGFLARNTTLLFAKYHLGLGPSHPFPTPNV